LQRRTKKVKAAIGPLVGRSAVGSSFGQRQVAIQGFKISALDTRAKVSEMVAKLESEIADLKKKLQAMEQ